MRFDLVTIFPEFFDTPLRVSLLGKAIESGTLQIGVHDLRNWAEGPHRKVDDDPFGGGAGMVMSAGPIVSAVEEIRGDRCEVVILAAGGYPFSQDSAVELARSDQVIIVCGRYEGIDARAAEILSAQEISIGPYVLAGGESAGLVILESVARLIPGVIGNVVSLAEESFSAGLLEYPQYTRPQEFRGHRVPEVLLSGDHAKIANWRRRVALERTAERNPQLLGNADLTAGERDFLAGVSKGRLQSDQ